MRLEGINLQRFRNFDDENIRINGNSAIVVGENGQGKTNLLEAIHFASSGKSWRTKNYTELIKLNETDCFIAAEFLNNSTSKKVDISINNDGEKNIKINKKKLGNDTEYFGEINVVFFSPEDINIINSVPSIRRNFINFFSAQLSVLYKEHLMNYNRIVTQRNKALLKNEKLEMDIWTEQLIEEGLWITARRINNLKKFVVYFKEFYSILSNKTSNNVMLLYKSSIGFLMELNNFNENTIKDLSADTYQNRLREVKEREEQYHETMIGPHRDDIIFVLDNFDARKFSSRGEQRLLALALKLSQYKIIEDEIREMPIILIDDVLSELDETRRNNFLKNLNNGSQIFMAGTDEKLFGSFPLENVIKIKVKNGKILS